MYKGLAESIVVIFLAALGIADALRLSSVIRREGTFHDVIGPDRYLGAISVGLLLCGIWALAKNLKIARSPLIKKEEGEGSQVNQVVLVVFVLVLYAFAMPILGYLLATAFFFPIIYFIFGVRPWLKSIIVGLSTSAVFYAIFAYLAEMPLPKGIFEYFF
jgi:putative tricarboxylic transport membrane protein